MKKNLKTKFSQYEISVRMNPAFSPAATIGDSIEGAISSYISNTYVNHTRKFTSKVTIHDIKDCNNFDQVSCQIFLYELSGTLHLTKDEKYYIKLA